MSAHAIAVVVVLWSLYFGCYCFVVVVFVVVLWLFLLLFCGCFFCCSVVVFLLFSG